MATATYEKIVLPEMATKSTAVWLASTKLTAPARRHDALLRARLVQALKLSLEQSRLTLVSAPAGAGKTTLLAELPHSFPQTKWAWLLLDSDDNDPSRLVAALIASLEAAGIIVEEQSATPGDARFRAIAIINQIAQSTGQFALVLDDLHVISEKSVHDVLDFLIDNLPPNLRIVLASRHDPPMSLARRRARGELGEIRLQDLSFTEDETSALVNQCLGLKLTQEEVTALQSRTEGWAAGLRLLATSLSQLPANRTSILQSGMQGSRRIFDFLAEEVLDRQTPDLRNFLLETSILASLRPDVCNTLTGRRDSVRILEDLYSRNLYVVAADESETSFRYHDLFADFLRERLRRERPDDWSGLHERAARAERSPHDRLRHFLAAESWDAAAADIETIGADYAARGFVVTLRRWIGELPDEIRLRHPRVLYLLAHAIWTQREFTEAEPFLEQALEGFRRNKDVVGQGEALAALANSALMNNRFDESREKLREALTYDLPGSSIVQIHTVSAWDAIYRQSWDEATEHIDRVMDFVESGVGSTNPLALMLTLFSTHTPEYIDRVEQICVSLRARLSGPPDLAHGCYHMLHSAVLANRGDPGSEQSASQALQIAHDCGQILLLTSALCTNFCLTSIAQGDWANLDRWATEGLQENKYGQIVRNWRLHYLYLQAWGRWHGGNIEGLRETYEAAMQSNSLEAPAALPYRHLIKGVMRMAERSYAQAEQAFREAVRTEDIFRVTHAVSSARVCLAYVLLVRGQAAEAMEAFTPALDKASMNIAGQLTRMNPIVIPLLRHAHERNIRKTFCERVLDLLSAPINAVEASGGEALSERELEVLRVMAEGLGNRDIAERLFVSEATVKTHVQRVLRKLDAASRTQAVARARELMLV
ncbi:MAG: LuxR C-terminal-related transcriptional regulator [Bryobacteraceae bacterium]